MGFSQEWIDGGPDWTRIEMPATQCTRIPAKFLEEERHRKPDTQFRQEYFCEFTSADWNYFDPESVAAAFRRGAANIGRSRLSGGSSSEEEVHESTPS